MLRELFIPYVQLPLQLHPSRRTQDGVALPQYMPVSLQNFQVPRFHVKQGPIEQAAPMLAPFQERLETLRCNHHDRKTPRQLRYRPHLLTIDPKACPTHALFDSNRVPLSGIVAVNLAEHSQGIRLVANHRPGFPGSKGTPEAEDVHRFQEARLAAAVRPDQEVDARVRVHHHIRQGPNVRYANTCNAHFATRDRLS